MPDTAKRVRIVRGVYGPDVLVDGQSLPGVNRIEFDYEYGVSGVLAAKITLLGVDIDLDGVTPDYRVKVVGPKPKE